jgi:uncharacterized membrane-anchored protein YitT (DUF2179 family)
MSDMVKQMIAKEKLSSLQTRTLDSVRMALQQINEDQENLSNQQLERTLTIISLASQLTEESRELLTLSDCEDFDILVLFSDISSIA